MPTKRAFRVTYPIISREGETADALSFNTSGWTNIYSLPGHTGFTAHMLQVADRPFNLPILKAVARFVFSADSTTTPAVRLASLDYRNGVATWSVWGEVTRRPAYNPDNLGIDITTALNTWRDTYDLVNPQLTIQVQGNGTVYLAEVEIDYLVPDYEPEITDLTQRVAALEAAASASSV